jgi:hypothetical protein
MTVSKLAVLCVAFAGTGSRVWACQDLTNDDNSECFKNVEWAKNTGIHEHPSWYADMPFLKSTSTLSDFQYALAVGEDAQGGGRSWNCSMPCTLTAEAKAHFDSNQARATENTAATLPAAVGAAVTVPAQLPSTTAAAVTVPAQLPSTTVEAATVPEQVVSTTVGFATLPSEVGSGTTTVETEGGTTTAQATTPAPDEKGWSMWVWVLIVTGVCCCLPLVGLACSAFICYESVSWIFGGSSKRSPQKKRAMTARASAPPAPPLAAAPLAPAAPFTYAPQQPVSAVQVPLTTYQQPSYPVQTYARAQPVSYTPVAYPAQQYTVAPAYPGQYYTRP